MSYFMSIWPERFIGEENVWCNIITNEGVAQNEGKTLYWHIKNDMI